MSVHANSKGDSHYRSDSLQIVAAYNAYTVYCILHIVYCILYVVYCILYIVYCILYIAYCILILAANPQRYFNLIHEIIEHGGILCVKVFRCINIIIIWFDPEKVWGECLKNKSLEQSVCFWLNLT